MQAPFPDDCPPLLVLDQVLVRGDPDFELGPLSFSLQPAERMAILGCSGAGKSLLLRTIAQLHPAASGTLSSSLHSFSGARRRDFQRHVGLAFQRDALLPHTSALENVAMAARGRGLSAPEERALELLGAMGLAAAAHKTPTELSGGMRKRVGLARALVSEPSLLLCDDTTAGLDPATEAEILSHIFAYLDKSRAALLFATHALDAVVPHMHRVGILEQGKLVFLGAPDALDKPIATSPHAPAAQGRSHV